MKAIVGEPAEPGADVGRLAGHSAAVPQDALRASVDYFKELFQEAVLADDELHSPAAAIILFQHLEQMGYQVTIQLDGETSTVNAYDENGDEVLGSGPINFALK